MTLPLNLVSSTPALLCHFYSQDQESCSLATDNRRMYDPKKIKNEHPGVNTMSRRQYYEDVLCAIGIGQSTSVDDDFPPFILE